MNSSLNKQSGMNIIELLSALAISAITLAFGVSGFQSIIASSIATTQVNDMVAGLNLARSEAIKRGVSVNFSALGGVWGDGWEVGVDANSDGDFYDAGDTWIRVWTPGQKALTPVNTEGLITVSYSSRGNAGVATTFRLTDCLSGTSHGRSLAIAASGHASASKVDCDE